MTTPIHSVVPKERSLLSRRWLSALAASVVISAGQSAHAVVTTFQWTDGATGLWSSNSTTTDWKTTTFVNGAGNIAKGSANTAGQVTLDTNVTIGQVSLTTGTTAIWTVAKSGNFTLTMDNTGGTTNLFGNSNAAISTGANSNTFNQLTVNPDIVISNTDLDIGATKGGLLIGSSAGSANITATTDQNLNIRYNATNASRNITINDNIGLSGSGNITLNHLGNGTATETTAVAGQIGSKVIAINQNTTSATLALSGNNSAFTGSVAIKAGSINASNSNALGSNNTVTLGDSLTNANAGLNLSGGISIANSLSVGSANVTGNTRTITNTSGANNITGNISLSGDLIVAQSSNTTNNALTLTNAGSITGTGNITFSGTGTQAIVVNRALDTGSITNSRASGNVTFTGAFGANRTLFHTGAGTTVLGAASITGATNVVQIDAGTVSLSGTSQTIAGLSAAASGGTLTNNSTSATLTLGGSGNYTFAGNITSTTPANLGLIKSGNGTQTLAGSNTYTGSTAVNGGTLLINGTTAAGSAVSVASGATLGGNGTINGSTTVSGAIAPGSTGFGTLNLANGVTWNAGNAWKFDLGASGTSDLVSITGNFSKGTGSGFTFDFSGNAGVAGTWTLATWTGSTTFVSGNFAATNLGSLYNGVFNVGSTSLTFTAVPEPATGYAVAFGLLFIALVAKRRVGAQQS